MGVVVPAVAVGLVAVARVELVVAGTTEQDVTAAATGQRVVAAAPPDDVRTRRPLQHIVAGSPDDQIGGRARRTHGEHRDSQQPYDNLLHPSLPVGLSAGGHPTRARLPASGGLSIAGREPAAGRR